MYPNVHNILCYCISKSFDQLTNKYQNKSPYQDLLKIFIYIVFFCLFLDYKNYINLKVNDYSSLS